MSGFEKAPPDLKPLLSERISGLRLKIEGSPMEPFVADLYRELEAALPVPQRAPALADGTGEDEHVFLRGNYHTLGERVPRRPPEVFPGSGPCAMGSGSGRLEFAREMRQARLEVARETRRAGEEARRAAEEVRRSARELGREWGRSWR